MSTLQKDPLSGKFFSLLALFLMLFSGGSLGQGPPLVPSIKSFPPSAYKAHPQIFCAERDPTKGIFFGTFAFVLHYNGEDWEKIHVSNGKSVFALDIDEKGRVWAGGQSEFGYLRPVPPSDANGNEIDAQASFDSSKIDGTKKPTGSLEYVSLTHLLPDSLRDFNIVWKVHAMEERVFFNAYNRMFVLEDDSLQSISPRKRGKFYRSYEVDGNLWVQDRGMGLYQIPLKEGAYRGDTLLPSSKLPRSEPFSKMPVTNVLDRVPGMIRADKKEVLVATRNRGFYRYRYGPSVEDPDERVTPINKDPSPILNKALAYHTIVIEPEKNPWGASLVVTTIKQGAILLDSTARPVKVLGQDHGMASNQGWRTIKGARGSGMLWTMTSKGISSWTPGDPRTFAREGDAFSGTVEAITRYHGKLFLATGQGVYYRTQEDDPRGSKWEFVPGTREQCVDLLPIGPVKKPDRSLLIAEGEGIFEIRDKKSGKDEPVKARHINERPSYDLTPLPSYKDRDWTAIGGKAGLHIFSRNDKGVWQERIDIREPPEEVNSISITTKEKTKGVVLWAGLPSKGGFRLSLDSRAFSRSLRSDTAIRILFKDLLKGEKEGIQLTPFTGQGAERKGLPKGPVRFFPFKDRVLAGTDSGLFRPRIGSKGSLHWKPDTSFGCLFGKCSGGGSDQVRLVFRLKEGHNGSVWIASPKVHRLTPQPNGGYRIDSIPFSGMNLGAVRTIYPDSSGITWIGGDNGVVRYDPSIEKDFDRDYSCHIKKVSATLPDTAEEITDSLLFGGFYRKPAPNDPLLPWKRSQDQPEAYVPELPYELNGLTFRFGAPYFERQEELRYSYRLDGFKEGWSEWTKEVRKEYTNLPEGTYTFKVKAKNVYGVESSMDEYRFRILPPWYRTWTAYGGYSVAGLGFIWLLLWLNSRRLIAQKQRLEKIVRERTKEIQEEKKEVERQKERVEEQQQETEKQREEAEKQRDLAEERRSKIEEAHQEITRSIEYAQKIQYALLQSEEYVSPHLPGHFILFKPQSQVSGDFYWAREHKAHLYVAAVDCTGHGVPGAFMSMLGISQLNEIMATDELLTPGAILTELRERVVRELSGSEFGETAKDGMDAALLRIPLDEEGTKTIAFAGAQNPLYLVRKGIAEKDPRSLLEDLSGLGINERLKPFKKSSDGIEIKGDPIPVGYDEYASGDFTTVSLQLQKGDMLYIFSDGYADQFGGPKGKKFRYGPFKELMTRIHEQALEDQKEELDRTFEEWKEESEQEQIDDVVVIGIRI